MEITNIATLGAGCFWCVEAIFQQLEGVESVISGYSGGTKENPTYEEVCTGTTGHAEVCQIVFDPELISYDEILEVFWKTHDPTQLNRQGEDIGTQYRSVIFYHDDLQKQIAEEYLADLNEMEVYNAPVVTVIEPFTKFYQAEEYHHNYFNLHPEKAYCALVVKPKVEKFKKVFEDRLKEQ